MSISQWSTTAGNNASGVTNINWAEGMPPASVNDSSRQEMADVATWYRTDGEWIDRDDATSFSSGTIVLLTGQNVTSIYNVGRRIRTVSSTPGTLYGRITASSTSGANTVVTITFDSTAVLSNEAITDIAVGIIGNSTGTQSLDAQNIARISQFGTPTGVILEYSSTTAPTGYLLCDGSGVSRTTFADLFAVISTSFGSTSTGTFAVPDRRGRVGVGLDNMGGTSANRLTSTAADTLGGTLGNESTSVAVTITGSVSAHTLTLSEIPAHTHDIDCNDAEAQTGRVGVGGASVTDTFSTKTAGGGGSHTHNDTFAASSTDLVNLVQPSIAFPYIIKT